MSAYNGVIEAHLPNGVDGVLEGDAAIAVVLVHRGAEEGLLHPLEIDLLALDAHTHMKHRQLGSVVLLFELDENDGLVVAA